MSKNDEIIKLKGVKSKLLKNVNATLPLIEEISNAGLVPCCLIGFKVTKEEKIQSLFATLNDDHDIVVLEICKALLVSHGYAVTDPEPNQQSSTSK